MASFDACRFDFRLDDKKGLTPSYRRRHAHRKQCHPLTTSANYEISEEEEDDEVGDEGDRADGRGSIKMESPPNLNLEPGEIRKPDDIDVAVQVKQEVVYDDRLNEQRAFTTPTITSSTCDKQPVRRQRKRRALIVGSGQLTMCSYCSGLFDDRKSLLSHQLTDLQCQEKQESKEGQIPNSQYRMAVLRKLKRLANNKVALKQESKEKYEKEMPSNIIDQSAVSLGTITLLRDLVKQPSDCLSTPLSPFNTPLEPLPFPLPEQTTATNLSIKRTAIVAPLVNTPTMIEQPIDLSLKRKKRDHTAEFYTTRMQLKQCKPTGKMSLTEISTLKCPQCGMTVSRPSFMAAHQRRWHSTEVDKKTTVISCMWCEFSCSEETTFINHVKQHHH